MRDERDIARKGRRPDHRGDDGTERLARLLRAADPAATGGPLPPTELAAVRRALIGAARERSSRHGSIGWAQTAMAGGLLATAAAAALLAVSLWRAEPPRPPAPSAVAPEAGASGTIVTPSPAPSVPSAAAPESPVVTGPGAGNLGATAALPGTADPAETGAATAGGPAPAVISSAPAPATADAAVIPGPTAPTEAAGAVADTPPRTLQFTAPRGTRIIWTIDPNFKFPFTEPRARQEHGR